MRLRPAAIPINVVWLFSSVSAPIASADPEKAAEQTHSRVTKYAAALTSAFELVRKGECLEAHRVLAGTAPDLRGWEFEYLDGVAADCPTRNTGDRVPGLHGPIMDNGVNVALADPTRPLVTLPCLDGTLRLLHLGDSAGIVAGKPKITTAFAAGSQIINGAFSGDGSVYAVGAENGRVFVWRPDGSPEADSIDVGNRPVIAVAINKSGTRMITQADRGEVVLWSLPDRKRIRVLGESWRYGRAVQFSPDGRLIALAGLDKIGILSSESGEALREIGPHGHYIMNLAFSPDGKLLASGTRGSIPKSVALFDVGTGERIFEFDGHSNGITGVAFTRDGTRLVSTSGDGTLRFVHLPSAVELLRLPVGAPFGDPHFSHDGRTLVWSGDRGLEFIKLQR